MVLSILLGAVVVAVYQGAPGGSIVTMLAHLITSLRSNNPAMAGYKAGIAGTLWLLGLVTAFAIPVGVGAGRLLLEEYAPPGRLRRIIQVNIANLAGGVLSIVYGLLGLAVFVRAFGLKGLALGPTLWAGGLTLSLLILPVIVIATQEALRTVPSSLRQAAMRARRVSMAGRPRPCPPFGAAGHPDRRDSGDLPRHWRDGPSPHGRRGRLDPHHPELLGHRAATRAAPGSDL